MNLNHCHAWPRWQWKGIVFPRILQNVIFLMIIYLTIIFIIKNYSTVYSYLTINCSSSRICIIFKAQFYTFSSLNIDLVILDKELFLLTWIFGWNLLILSSCFKNYYNLERVDWLVVASYVFYMFEKQMFIIHT